MDRLIHLFQNLPRSHPKQQRRRIYWRPNRKHRSRRRLARQTERQFSDSGKQQSSVIRKVSSFVQWFDEWSQLCVQRIAFDCRQSMQKHVLSRYPLLKPPCFSERFLLEPVVSSRPRIRPTVIRSTKSKVWIQSYCGLKSYLFYVLDIHGPLLTHHRRCNKRLTRV